MHKTNERCIWTSCCGAFFFFALLAVFSLAGCDSGNGGGPDEIPKVPSTGDDAAQPPNNRDQGKRDQGSGAVGEATELTEGYSPLGQASVSWRVTRLAGSKIGHSQVTDRNLVNDQGERATLIELEDQTRVKRFNQNTEQKYTVRSLLDADGSLLAFDGELNAGPTAVRTRGRVVGDRLRLETTTGAEIQVDSIPWKSSYGGIGADELSLRNAPLKPGETRKLQMLAPVLHQVMTVEWTAGSFRDVVLPDGKKARLLEIKEKSVLPGIALEGVRWADEQGLVWMTTLPAFQQTTYRTTQDNALADDGGEFDLGLASVIAVQFPATLKADPHASKRVVYRAELERSDPAESFPRGASQSIRKVDSRTVEIEVIAVRPDQPSKIEMGDDGPPSDGDIKPNALIQSGDSRVIALAAEVEAADPWKAALALESLVNDRIQEKDFSQAFASAADVAEHLKGDCTEHAVLLAALCRAKGIPARVVIGLVYYNGSFAYHMWNEVWVGGRWTPLDATLARGGIGAAHLKVVSTNLEGASPYAAFLPVLPLLQQLKLKVIEGE